MTLKKFRELTVDLPEDTVLVCPAPDHSYREARAVAVVAEHDPQSRYYGEDWDGAKPEHRVKVVLVS
jgi:hypothetical protein